jgi:hypothetical protein
MRADRLLFERNALATVTSVAFTTLG